MFAHRLKLFELSGFQVSIDASWLLLAVLIVWSLAVGYFPNAVPGLTSTIYWWMGVAGLIGLAASIVLHEFAHSVAGPATSVALAGVFYPDRHLWFGFDPMRTLYVGGQVSALWMEGGTREEHFEWATAEDCIQALIKGAARFALLAEAVARTWSVRRQPGG